MANNYDTANKLNELCLELQAKYGVKAVAIPPMDQACWYIDISYCGGHVRAAISDLELYSNESKALAWLNIRCFEYIQALFDMAAQKKAKMQQDSVYWTNSLHGISADIMEAPGEWTGQPKGTYYLGVDSEQFNPAATGKLLHEPTTINQAVDIHGQPVVSGDTYEALTKATPPAWASAPMTLSDLSMYEWGKAAQSVPLMQKQQKLTIDYQPSKNVMKSQLNTLKQLADEYLNTSEAKVKQEKSAGPRTLAEMYGEGESK